MKTVGNGSVGKILLVIFARDGVAPFETHLVGFVYSSAKDKNSRALCGLRVESLIWHQENLGG
jgi:hypothetical protein